MDIAKLKDELTNDPLGVGYAGMNAQQVAESMNATSRPTALSLDMVDLFEAVGPEIAGRMSASLKAMAQSLSLYEDFRAMAQNGRAIDVNNAMTHLVLDGMAADPGVPLTVADATAIKALSHNKRSRASELGLGEVKVGHVQQARM